MYQTSWRNRKGDSYSFNIEELNHTVRHAILVTKALDFTYLWVDTLCIVQDDEEDKRKQLDNMDAIYKTAILTIVAASGHHADYGIVGASYCKQREKQRIARWKTLSLAPVFPSLDSLLKDLRITWNNRGWTFQEKVLSKRLLVFTDQQVYFRCSNTVWCEDIAMETNELPENHLRKDEDPLRWPPDRAHPDHMPQIGDVFKSAFGPMDDETSQTLTDLFAGTGLEGARIWLCVYALVLREYTRRNFTNPNDIPYAINGVLRTLTQLGVFKACIPVKFIDAVLLWRPASRSSCTSSQRNIPSWSWAHWNFSNGCEWNSLDFEDLTRSMYQDEFLWRNGQKSSEEYAFKLSNWGLDLQHRPSLSMWMITRNDKMLIRLENLAMNENIPRHREPPDDWVRIQQNLGVLECVLYFHTTRLSLQLGELIVIQGQPQNIKPDEHHRFELLDRSHDRVGEIWTTQSVVNSAGPNLNFITLSWGGKAEGTRIAPHLLPSTPRENEHSLEEMEPAVLDLAFNMANVMLVERNSAHDPWRRVALGKVIITAWLEADRFTEWAVLA